jgi:hypothetical protein
MVSKRIINVPFYRILLVKRNNTWAYIFGHYSNIGHTYDWIAPLSSSGARISQHLTIWVGDQRIAVEVLPLEI